MQVETVETQNEVEDILREYGLDEVQVKEAAERITELLVEALEALAVDNLPE